MKFKPKTFNRKLLKHIQVMPRLINGHTVGLTKRAMDRTYAAGSTGRNAVQECLRLAIQDGEGTYPLGESTVRGYKLPDGAVLIYMLGERV